MSREGDAIRMMLSTTGVRESLPENDYEVWMVRKSVIKFLEDSIGAERMDDAGAVSHLTDSEHSQFFDREVKP